MVLRKFVSASALFGLNVGVNALVSLARPDAVSAQACVSSAECNAPLQCIGGACAVPATQPAPVVAPAPAPVAAPAPAPAPVPVTYSV